MISISELYTLFRQHRLIDTDSRRIREGSIFFALKGDHFDGNRFVHQALEQGAAWAVADDPGLQGDRILHTSHALGTLQELASLHRKNLRAKVLAITGSNGKTTSKELLRQVLQPVFQPAATEGNLNNHIGVPLTILKTGEDQLFLILEMGANHSGEIYRLCEIGQPDYGLITNIGKAHLEGFGSREGVYRAKTELYRYLKETGGLAFYDPDIPLLSKGIEEFAPRSKPINRVGAGELSLQAAYRHDRLTVDLMWGDHKHSFSTAMFGRHNISNMKYALAAGDYFGVPLDEMMKSLETYQPVHNRSEIRNTGTNILVLDAYNANPDSMQLALQEFELMEKEKKVVILGDMKELGDHEEPEHRKVLDMLSSKNSWDIFLVGPVFHRLAAGEFRSFEHVQGLIRFLESGSGISNSLVLLKGSRAIALEKVLPVMG